MYTLIKMMPIRQFLLEQLPAIGVSFIIAEHFYKFHSFTLECIAFLATWFVADGLIRYFLSHFDKSKTSGE